MRIEKISIRGLRALRRRDDVFVAPGQRAPLPSICLRGLNGSGKTTYLEAIAQLFQWFQRCTKTGRWAEPKDTPLLKEADLVAVRLVDLPGPLASEGWLVWGQGDALRDFLRDRDDALAPWTDGAPRWRSGLLSDWDRRFQLSELGHERAPNIVWIEAENKWVPPLEGEELLESTKGPVQPVVVRYSPEARGAHHLEGILGTLKLVDERRFDDMKRWIPELLPGLQLQKFDSNRRPLFAVAGVDTRLTVDRLSAGERSVLINLALVARWLSPGGVVLLDEPELHQHLSLMRGSLAVLEAFVEDQGGQLFVASHAPEVWAHFRRSGSLIELEGRSG